MWRVEQLSMYYFSRRPDLGEIELTCKNTNTELPYVDLVLEILETAVANNGNLPVALGNNDDSSFPYQTTADTNVLNGHARNILTSKHIKY